MTVTAIPILMYVHSVIQPTVTVTAISILMCVHSVIQPTVTASVIPILMCVHSVIQPTVTVSAIPILMCVRSAGVGRTGTYIALDIAIDHTEQQEAEINLYDIVDKLREDRCHMVQNKVDLGDTFSSSSSSTSSSLFS